MEVARSTLNKIQKFLMSEQEKHGVLIDENKNSLNFGLAAVVYEWARGTAFQNITQLTSTQEGSIVRCITRLDEACKDVRNAARVIGNPSLYRKMEAASQCIKRDIVFAASLYVT
jgi:antiviral helicase SKI2